MNKKKFEALFYSVAGVIAMLIILVAANFIAGAAKTRIDLTSEKLYTLSPGTKAILENLETPVQIRFYVTRGENQMPMMLKNYAQRVEDLLDEYRQHAKGNIEIKKFDPEPDSDAEDAATLDGVEGQLLPSGEKIYLGLAITQLDETVALPFLSPDREKLLEYDISRAISRVMNPEKPVVGVMTALPVFGQPANPMMMRMGQQGQDPWVFISELQRDFTLEQVDMSVEKIDERIKVLLLVHPKGLSDAAQFAIDQFILRGGRLVAFLDPQSIMDRSGANPMLGNMGGGSTLDKLLKAWGIEFDTSKVVADMNYMSRVFRGNRAESAPAFLSLTAEAINQDDASTGQIDSLLMPFAGAFAGTPAEGLKKTALLESSENSQLVEGFLAQMSGEQIVKDFKSSGTKHALAIRLSGKFKTAFPDGNPKAAPQPGEEAQPEAKPEESFLKESAAENAVILVGDADMLFDQFSVQVQEFFGQRILIPRNGNLNLVQNVVEQLAGDVNLIGARSRATLNRPFTLVNKMQAEAEQRYQSKIKELEESLAETQRRLNELQQSKEAGQRFILSPEQQAELENFRKKEAEVRKQIKEERKKLRREIDALENRIKWANIAGMPLIVTLFGIALAFIKRKRTAAK